MMVVPEMVEEYAVLARGVAVVVETPVSALTTFAKENAEFDPVRVMEGQ